MSMDDKDKKMLIRACIDKVFIPHAMIHISAFLLDFKNKTIYAHDYQQITGYPISINPPATLDLRPSAEALESALMTSFKTFEEAIQPKQ